MKTVIRIRRNAERLPPRGESGKIPVPAGWYEKAEYPNSRVFCVKQTGGLDGGYVDRSRPGTVVMFVRVALASCDADL